MHALVSIICASILLQVLITMCNNKNVYVYLSAFVSSNHILLPGCVSAPIVASLRREMSACKYIIDVGVLNTFVWMLTNLFLLLGVWKENFFLIKTCFVLFFCFHRHVISCGYVGINVYVRMGEKVSEKKTISINRLTTSKHISNWSNIYNCLLCRREPYSVKLVWQGIFQKYSELFCSSPYLIGRIFF